MICPSMQFLACSDATGHIEPHGGSLVDLLVTDASKRAALERSATHQQECSDRNACDVELLSVGGFSPLSGFMNQDAYEHVVEKHRCDMFLEGLFIKF